MSTTQSSDYQLNPPVTMSRTRSTSSESSDSSPLRTTLVSIGVVISVALSWACATQFSKSALDLDHKKFYAPYSLVWFSTCFMTICYPVYLLYSIIRREPFSHTHHEAMQVFGKSGFTILQFFIRVVPFLLLWIGANYCYSQGLGHISASAASALMSSNVAMVGILSVIILRDRITFIKVFAVVLAIAGVVVISLDSEFAGSVIGVLLVIASALFAAFYKVLFKKLIGDASLGQVSAFMSGLGLINTTFNFIPTLILVLTDIDTIDFHYVPWGPLVGSAILGLLFNFIVNFGISLLNPLVISVGMLCGIPVSAIIDFIFRGMHATPKFIIGAVLILLSFIFSAFPIANLFSRFRGRKHTSYDVSSSS
uniref:EamA domain-containing protein n=1 Tax=Panagrellus redivivus TaxID=6233 RepID=A0A7E4V2J0_PANRE